MTFMELKIQPLRKEDYSKVISFAIRGMHFERYFDSRLLTNLYGKYFWYGELNDATQVIAAYYGDELAGVLLADMKGEKKACYSPWRKLFTRFIDFLTEHLDKVQIDPYFIANSLMYKEYSEHHKLDGEINFLAANPDLKIHGIGTFLLAELERREKGKHLYVYTDNNCTYQFYEHRGFEQVGKKEIDMQIPGMGDVPLTCFMYSKVCGV